MASNGGHSQPSGVSLQDALQNVDVLDELPLPDEQVSKDVYIDLNKAIHIFDIIVYS